MDDLQRVIDNIEWLMADAGLKKNTELARAAKVSPSHVGNILHRRSFPTIDFLQKIARAFGKETWQLLAPTAMLDKAMGVDLGRVTDAYRSADNSGRETILRVAEAQAQYSTHSSTDQDEKKED